MMTDPIADMLTRIRNALMAGHKTVEMTTSGLKEGIAGVLKKEGYIDDFRTAGDPPHRLIKIYLRYGPLGEKAINQIARVSKPGRRIHCSVTELPYVHNGLGISVVSTSHGILSDRECRKLNSGGEVICSVF